MKINLPALLPIMFLFYSCTTESNEANDVESAMVHQRTTGKILISYKGEGDGHSTLSYHDYFGGEHMLILEKANRTIELDVKDFLVIRDIGHQSQASYILLPGDTLEFVKAEGEKVGYFRGRDSVRNSELAIFPEIAKTLGSLSSPLFDLAMLKKVRKTPVKLDSVLGRQYSDRSKAIMSYARKHVVRPELLQITENVLKYDYLKERLIVATFRIPKEHRANIVGAAEKLLGAENAEAYTYPAFRSIGSQTVSILAREERDQGEKLIMMYNLYDELLKPELAELMRFYTLTNSFSQKQSTYPSLVADFMSRSNDQKLKDYLASQQKLAELRRSIDYEVALLDKKDQVSDLQAFLKKNEGNVVYVDLWASWCRPCLAEMPASKELQEQYKGRKVVFLYLSLDENKSSWMKALTSQKDVMSGQNSYLLLDNYSSAFAKKYDVKTIPRYLLIDKTGTVVDVDAPRPGEEETRTLIDSYLIK